MWLEPTPSAAQLQSLYGAEYFSGGGRGGYQDYLADEEQHRANAASRVNLAQKFGATAPATWLDIGCATGFTLDMARLQGFAAFGVELSAWARSVARDRLGLEVFSTLSDARRALAGQIDVVTMFQVLEHMSEPRVALEEVRACLRPHGLLLIETWDRSSMVARLFGRYWQQITPPSVLWLLDRKCITYLMGQAGFRLLTIHRTSKKISLGWALGLVADKLPKLLELPIRALARSPLGKLRVNYGLGDLVTVIALAPSSLPSGALANRPGS